MRERGRVEVKEWAAEAWAKVWVKVWTPERAVLAAGTGGVARVVSRGLQSM